MNRVAIIGSPGAGKSTFARRLGNLTGIEVYHLDQLYWKPGWVEMPKTEWMTLQQALVKESSWIIDGNYGNTMDIRLAAADTVILLDFPRRTCLWRALKRTIQYHGQTRPDMGDQCPERIELEFLRYIWNFRKQQQARIIRRIAAVHADGKEVVQLRSNTDVEAYLASIRQQ